MRELRLGIRLRMVVSYGLKDSIDVETRSWKIIVRTACGEDRNAYFKLDI